MTASQPRYMMAWIHASMIAGLFLGQNQTKHGAGKCSRSVSEQLGFAFTSPLGIAYNRVGGFFMPNVSCRPELHGATTREQYAKFHAGMKDFGFEQTIMRDGTMHHLPTGEYLAVNISTPMNLLALKIAGLALQVTGNKFLKLTLTPVRDPADIYIHGLDEEVSYASALAPLGV